MIFRERLKNEQNITYILLSLGKRSKLRFPRSIEYKRALVLTICSAEFGRTTVLLKFANDTLESASEHRGRMAYLTEVRRKRNWYFDCQLQDLVEDFKWLTTIHSQRRL